MIGHYIKGSGMASNYGESFRKFFNCYMFGTLNMQIDEPILNYKPCRHIPKTASFEDSPFGPRDVWLLKIDGHYAWGTIGGCISDTILEIFSKYPLPEDIKNKDVMIEVLERWDEEKIKSWATHDNLYKDGYVFQTFDWSAKEQADSKYVWDKINILSWQDKRVLDIGSNHGYFSFQASAAGALIIGVERHKGFRDIATTINDHIEMQDVRFAENIPEGQWDIILYLSVHHNIDPSYKNLAGMMEELRKIAKEVLFIELILPPNEWNFGNALSEEEIDTIIKGEVLARYKHRIRGIRKIYMIKTAEGINA